jgi:uncharacterized protein (DUF305 family)
MTRRQKVAAGAATAVVLVGGAGTAAMATAGHGGPFGSGSRMGADMMDSASPAAKMHGGGMGSRMPGRMAAGDMGAGRTGVMGSHSGMAGMRVDSEFSYLTQMIPHHQEAITAAKQLQARSNRREMKAFAADIIATQTAQVDQMKRELANWYPGRSTSVTYTPMMRDLTQLSGDALDRVFLEDMIPHHGMAVMTSQQLLVRDLSRHAEARQLARTIRDGQLAEIQKMGGWLQSWFGENPMNAMMGGRHN